MSSRTTTVTQQAANAGREPTAQGWFSNIRQLLTPTRNDMRDALQVEREELKKFVQARYESVRSFK